MTHTQMAPLAPLRGQDRKVFSGHRNWRTRLDSNQRPYRFADGCIGSLCHESEFGHVRFPSGLTTTCWGREECLLGWLMGIEPMIEGSQPSALATWLQPHLKTLELVGLEGLEPITSEDTGS